MSIGRDIEGICNVLHYDVGRFSQAMRKTSLMLEEFKQNGKAESVCTAFIGQQCMVLR